MKTTEEKNRMIAEFMGYEFDGNVYKTPHTKWKWMSSPISQEGFDSTNELTINELDFHTSWDWLMPVVEKVSRFTDEHVIMNVDSRHNRSECLLYYEGRFLPHISNAKLIDNTYTAVVKFIEWYNKNK